MATPPRSLVSPSRKGSSSPGSAIARRASTLGSKLVRRLSMRGNGDDTRAKLAQEMARDLERAKIIRQALSPGAERFLKLLFARNDLDDSNCMDVAELRAMVKKDLNLNMSDDEIVELATQFDADSDGELSENEFLCLMATRVHMPDASQEAIKNAFRVRRRAASHVLLAPRLSPPPVSKHTHRFCFFLTPPPPIYRAPPTVQRFDKAESGAHTGSLEMRQTIEKMKAKGSLTHADVADLEDMFTHALSGECRDPHASDSILYERFVEQMFGVCAEYDQKVKDSTPDDDRDR